MMGANPVVCKRKKREDKIKVEKSKKEINEKKKKRMREKTKKERKPE